MQAPGWPPAHIKLYTFRCSNDDSDARSSTTHAAFLPRHATASKYALACEPPSSRAPRGHLRVHCPMVLVHSKAASATSSSPKFATISATSRPTSIGYGRVYPLMTLRAPVGIRRTIGRTSYRPISDAQAISRAPSDSLRCLVGSASRRKAIASRTSKYDSQPSGGTGRDFSLTSRY